MSFHVRPASRERMNRQVRVRISGVAATMWFGFSGSTARNGAP